MRAPPRRVATIAAALLAFALVALGSAQPSDRYRIPGTSGVADGGATVVRGPAGSFTYVTGVGWSGALAGSGLAPPEVAEDGGVTGSLALARALGVDLPALAGVRFGGTGPVRIVLDIAGTDDAAALATADGIGATRPPGVPGDAALTLSLPALLLPAEHPEPYGSVAVELSATAEGTKLALFGPVARYEVFTLRAPVRVVVDVAIDTALAAGVPERGAEPSPERRDRGDGGSVDGSVDAPAPERREPAPGIVYRTLRAPTPVGPTEVHVVEIAPGAAELRVVGGAREGRDVLELASGGVVAINAGYFDPDTFDPIGLLRVDGALLGLPSRNRAVAAFGGGRTTIARAEADISVWVDGAWVATPPDAVRVSAARGAPVGGPQLGVIALRSRAARALEAAAVFDGTVVSNTVGPVVVPAAGGAIVYPPELRALALADRGERVAVDLRVRPDAVGRAPYAVEAGPLLLQDGRPDFRPEDERFVRGRRILDAYTQQSAIAVRGDGTTLFVVAERMRAEDLLPLLRRLGARDAMRLDSGSSSALVVDGEIVNTERRREIVSAIVAVAVADTGPRADLEPAGDRAR